MLASGRGVVLLSSDAHSEVALLICPAEDHDLAPQFNSEFDCEPAHSANTHDFNAVLVFNVVGVEDVEEGRAAAYQSRGLAIFDGGGDLEEQFFAPDSVGSDAADAIVVRHSRRAKVEAALEAVLTDAACDTSVAKTDVVVPVGKNGS